jgi:hypothetical protein
MATRRKLTGAERTTKKRRDRLQARNLLLIFALKKRVSGILEGENI